MMGNHGPSSLPISRDTLLKMPCSKDLSLRLTSQVLGDSFLQYCLFRRPHLCSHCTCECPFLFHAAPDLDSLFAPPTPTRTGVL